MVFREDRRFKCQKLHCNATNFAPFIFVFFVADKKITDRVHIAYHNAHTSIMMKRLLAVNVPIISLLFTTAF